MIKDTKASILFGVYGGWAIVCLLTVFPIAVWLSTIDISAYANMAGVLRIIAKTTGIAGFMLYAINLILAARVKWLEPFFGGLNRVYIAHHITGGIALILLLIHPVALAFRLLDVSAWGSLRDVALYLLPRTISLNETWKDSVYPLSVNAGFIAFYGMVVLLIITFFVKLPYRIWLLTHRFLGVAFMFAGLHIIFIDSDITQIMVLKIYTLMFTTLGLAAFIYRSVMGKILVRRYQYKVVLVHEFEGDVTGIALDPIGQKMSYKPGQFVFINFPRSSRNGLNNEVHPFSIASSPDENQLRIDAKALGDYTSNLKNLQVGDIAEIEGAYGKFTFTRFGDKPQIWIAGGIGVTPFLSMARTYNDQHPPVDMIYSVVHATELLEAGNLAHHIPTMYPRFRFFPYVADNEDGFLTADKIETMCGGLMGKEIFICGPPPMMKSLKKQLIAKGVPKIRIHTEEFAML